jgi:predicted dehydrogenase
MRALVVGGGSIGKRHLQNLLALGVSDLIAVEPDPSRRSSLENELRILCCSDLTVGLSTQPDFAVIASPTCLHLAQALKVANLGINLFVEKPLAHGEGEMPELASLCERKHLVSMVACNMRFHPGPARVKRLLLESQIGKVLFARIHMGSYLPEWRPASDYRMNYAAHKDSGGGCILDCIHEIDLARWYLGEVSTLVCMSAHLSSLEIETEDVAAIICRHESGAISEIHLDYVQRSYERGCEIVGETGSIRWNYNDGCVRLLQAESGRWEDYPQSSTWQTNEMYLDEMKHFLQCVEGGKQTVLPIPEAVRVTRIALAAKESSESGRRIHPAREVVV